MLRASQVSESMRLRRRRILKVHDLRLYLQQVWRADQKVSPGGVAQMVRAGVS